MKLGISVILLLLFSLQNLHASERLEQLGELEWQKRLLFIKTQQPEHVARLFEQYRADLKERNIIWFMQVGDRLSSNLSRPLSERVIQTIDSILSRVAEDSLVLMGYDGEIKSTNNGLDMQRVMGQIDRMPIRQMEMQ